MVCSPESAGVPDRFGPITVLAAACLPTVAAAQHFSLARDPSNTATVTIREAPAFDFDMPAWIFPASDPTVAEDVRFVGQSSAVADGWRVFAISSQNASAPARLWAIDAGAGLECWRADLPNLPLDSWSSPAIDRETAAVYVAAGAPGSARGEVIAFDVATGAERWRFELDKDVVNASPTITRDLGRADRLFITDYEGFYAGGAGGSLYAINIDPFDEFANPFEPGELVWRAPLNHAMSGATPAYADGRVVVSTSGNLQSRGGRVVCFDASADGSANPMLWDTAAADDDAFFGGVTIRDGAVYAATYDFNGGRDSARLVKLALATGEVVWTTPCNRTTSIPVALPDGRVLLSGGIFGFGSAPSIQVFEDNGSEASLVYDSVDAGETVGGWTNQPLVVTAEGVTTAYAGVLASGGLFPGYTELVAIDLSGSTPTVVSRAPGAGASPAMGTEAIYSIGPNGLFAYGRTDGPSACEGVFFVIDRLGELALDSAVAGEIATDLIAEASNATPCEEGGQR